MKEETRPLTPSPEAQRKVRVYFQKIYELLKEYPVRTAQDSEDILRHAAFIQGILDTMPVGPDPMGQEA